MTELETIQHAKNYLDKLARGINPLTDEPVPEEELINNVRISRCFFYVSDVLRRVLENGGVGSVPRAKQNTTGPGISLPDPVVRVIPYSAPNTPQTPESGTSSGCPSARNSTAPRRDCTRNPHTRAGHR